MKTTINASLLFKLWHDYSLRTTEVAARLGCSPRRLSAEARRYGLPRRKPTHKPRADDLDRQAGDPTPEEIALRAAAIRATWGPDRFRLTHAG